MFQYDVFVENRIQWMIRNIRYADESVDLATGGLGCYGFVVYFYREIPGINLPDDIFQANGMFDKVDGLSNAKYLDVPYFISNVDGKRHVGVLLDNRNIVHCSSSGNGVSKLDLLRIPYLLSMKSIHRYKGLPKDEI